MQEEFDVLDLHEDTSRFFSVWGGTAAGGRADKNILHALLLQTAIDLEISPKQRDAEKIRSSALYWCTHPKVGMISLELCMEILFPDLMGVITPEQFGEYLIKNASEICKLDHPCGIAQQEPTEFRNFSDKIFQVLYKEKKEFAKQTIEPKQADLFEKIESSSVEVDS